jgi:hypothetical protein
MDRALLGDCIIHTAKIIVKPNYVLFSKLKEGVCHHADRLLYGHSFPCTILVNSDTGLGAVAKW